MPISSGTLVDSAEIGLRVSVLGRTRLEEKEALLYCNCPNEMKHTVAPFFGATRHAPPRDASAW